MPNHPTRWQIAGKLFKMLAVMTISYFVLMSLYFAAEVSVTQLPDTIKMYNLDQSLVGSFFVNFTQQDNQLPGDVNWTIQSGYKSVQDVVDDVDDGDYWGAIIVNANASTMLNKAVSSPLKDYDPKKAFLFVYDTGRNPLVVRPYVVAQMYQQFMQFVSAFNPFWVQFVLTFAQSQNSTVIPLKDAPQTLGSPLAFEERDLHPPTATIITSATSVAYIWIFLIAGGSTYLVANVVQPITRNASVRTTMTVLLLPLFVFLCSLSMTYSVLLRLFGVPFNSAGQFVSLFLAMLLLQAAVASLVLFLIFLIPVTMIPMITTTFVVMNVIAVFNPVELMPHFYRWVYAMPFLNAVQMVRFVLMGSYNRLAYNLPILFAWIMVPITLLPFAITRQKRLLMEVLELEEREYEQQQRYDHKKDRYMYRSDGLDDEDTYDGDTFTTKTHPPRRTRSRSRSIIQHHRNLDQEADDGDLDREHDGNSSFESEDGSSRDDDAGDGGDREEDVSNGSNEDGGQGPYSVTRSAQMIRPLNPPILSTSASPSAPTESQVFGTHNRLAEQRHLGQNRSYIEMPRLSRHPYASELVRSETPGEVK
ncbi:hypothetical protein BGX28_007686 [Mortierella sp. GBA30]|nr:hypothetical protein BGX28_007686 [Mortierella sp. GBA30]